MSVANPFSDDGSSLLATLLAIAIAAFALLFLKGFFAPPEAQRYRNPPNANNIRNTNRSAAAAAAAAAAAGGTTTATGHHLQGAAATPTTTSSQRSVRTLTISAPGVLLEETSPESFSEGATVLPSAVAALQNALKGAGGSSASGGSGSSNIGNTTSPTLLANTNVYILCQVSDDIGEAAVRAALEYSGLMGPNPGQIQSQRFLFCDTQVGKMSLVRQIEPEVHIDGDGSTVDQLKRFIPRLIQIKSNQTHKDMSQIESTTTSTTNSVVVVENFQQAVKHIFQNS